MDDANSWRSGAWVLAGVALIVLAAGILHFARSPQLPDYGTTVVGHEVQNPQAREGFLAAYVAGKPARWQLMVYTIEGDPLSYRLSYEGGGAGIRLVVDTRRDKFGKRRVTEYRCARLSVEPSRLRLAGCTHLGESVPDFTFPWEIRRQRP